MRLVCYVMILSALCIGWTAIAADGATPKSAVDYAVVVRRLSADDFPTRQAARRLLLGAGTDAVAPLQAAALASPESAEQFLDLLNRIADGQDAVGAQAARAALRELSDCDMPSLAQAVRGLRRSELPLSDADQKLVAPLTLPVNSARIVGGNRLSRFEDGGEAIEVTETPTGAVTVDIIRTIDGAPVRESYSGEHKGMLRLKSEEVFQIYRRYLSRVQDDGPSLWPPQPVIPGQTLRSLMTRTTNTHRRIRLVDQRVQIDVVEGFRADIEIRRTELIDGNEVRQELKAKDLESLRTVDPVMADWFERVTKLSNESHEWHPAFP